MSSHPPSAEAVRVRLCLPARSGHHAARGVIGLSPGGIRRHPSTERGCGWRSCRSKRNEMHGRDGWSLL